MCPRLPSFRREKVPSSSSSSSESPAQLNTHEQVVLDAYLDHLLPSSAHSASLVSLREHMNSSDISQVTVPRQNTLFGYPMPVDLFSALYTGAVFTGGLVGFFKAGSKPSLVAGIVFGSLLGYGTYLTSIDPDKYYVTLGTSSVLASVMGYRFAKNGKFMPAGLVCAFSLAMVTRCLYQMAVNLNKNTSETTSTSQ